MILAAGCSSSGDEGKGNDVKPVPSAVIEEPATQPAAEPAVLPDTADSQPIVEPDLPAVPATEPVAVPATEPEAEPLNPLRNSGEFPASSQAVTNPPVVAGPLVAIERRIRPGKHRGMPFDPIKMNGPIFVDWPKPKLVLVITGRQEGYIEPCGCAGLDRMKGGMSRRHSLFTMLRKEKGWPVVGLDVGGIAKGYGRQAELKFHIMVEGMRKMGYDAIALGKTDLQLPAGELLAEVAGGGVRQGPFLSANVALFGFAAKMTAQTKIIEAAGMKLAIISVLGKQFQKEIHNDEIEMIDPEVALAKVVPDLKKRADYLILLAHATMEESIELARKFPDFDLVITAGGAAEPPARPARIKGTKTLLIEMGEKGMDAIVLAMFDDPQTPLRYQRVPLDSRFPPSVEMEMLMVAYQDQLRREGFSGLGIRAVPHPQKELGGRFVGSEKCKSCHEESYRIWKKSGHGKAYQTLVSLNPPRDFDPECVSCHVVGWHPTKFFPYEGGYKSLEETPQLIDTGCETCHGPGGAHVAAEMGSDTALQEKLQKAMVLTKAEAEKQQCISCHDLDNSPDFDFESYWPFVEHRE